jgi:hypothetical protein
MTDYLDNIGAGKILVDRGPLSFDWTPPNLVGRDKELGLLASMFMGIGSEGVSGRAVVIGHVGTGKTVLTRRFGEDVIRELDGVRKMTLLIVVIIPLRIRSYNRLHCLWTPDILRGGLALGKLFSR